MDEDVVVVGESDYKDLLTDKNTYIPDDHQDTLMDVDSSSEDGKVQVKTETSEEESVDK